MYTQFIVSRAQSHNSFISLLFGYWYKVRFVGLLFSGIKSNGVNISDVMAVFLFLDFCQFTSIRS